MIEQTGIVVAIEGDWARIETQRRPACGGCSADGACTTSLLARYFGRKQTPLRVRNSIGAVPGDQVVVGVPEGTLLAAAFAAYLIPLLALIGGAIAGAYLGDLVIPAYTQEFSILGGLGGFAGALLWLARPVSTPEIMLERKEHP